MIEIDTRDAGDVHALELWDIGGAGAVADVLGFALPPAGRSAGSDALRAIRVEPMVWLVEGDGFDPAALAAAVEAYGALTAIGGGFVRASLRGEGWRQVLMRDGVFDAESAAFGPGCVAATVIAHVAVRLHVVAEDRCDALVPASYAGPLVESWRKIAGRIG